MTRLIFLLFFISNQLFSQELLVGFVNFLIPKTSNNNSDLSSRFNLYTDSTCSDASYYGYLNYKTFEDRIYLYKHLVINLKDSLAKPDSLIPSIGYLDFQIISRSANKFDTLYKADEDSFFIVRELKKNKICFAINNQKSLWLKTNQYVKFYNYNDLLNKFFPVKESEYKQVILPESLELKKINSFDSLSLNKIASEFLKAFENKDTRKIKNHSLSLIHCQTCSSTNNNIIPLDSFITSSYNLLDNHLYGSMKRRGIKISQILLPNFHPNYLPNNYEKDLITYEARVMTYDSNELNNGQDGINYCFYFLKINEEFVFFMFDAIPK